MNITIIGSGAFAMSIASLFLRKKENQVHMWTHDEQFKIEIEKTNKFELKGFTYEVSSSLHVYTDLKEAAKKSNYIFLLISSDFMINVLENLKDSLKGKIIYIGTKGMLEKEPYFYTNFINENYKPVYTGFFLGPNLAQDILINENVSITISKNNQIKIEEIKALFPETVRQTFVENENDLELTGVMKNIYAIASGIILALTSSKSANITLLCLAYKELQSILKELKEDENIMGDFFLTGMMEESRNKSLGRAFVENNYQEYLKENTIEGYQNLKKAYNYLKKENKNTPIFDKIYSIISENQDPKTLLNLIFKEI